jgi:hypothetical protein
MFSRFATLVWEWRESGRWTLLQFLGIMLGLPVFIYVTLYWTHWRATGQFGPINDLPEVPTYYALVLMDIIVCGVGLASIAANPRRSYLLPAPSWVLALSKMLPTAVCAAAFYIISAGVLNLSFGAGWPLLGPALFIAVTSSATLAAAWIGQRAPWGACFGGLIVAGLLGFWFHTRHGAAWGDAPEHIWNRVTLWDAVALGLGLLCSFVTGTLALHFNRHEDVPSIWLSAPLAWTGRESTRGFRSREGAQLWFEWRHRVFAIPLLTIVISLGIPTIFFADLVYRFGWSWAPQHLSDLVEGQVMFALLSPIWNGLAIGVLVGLLNASPKDRSMGAFRGTLPVSDRWQANQVLRAALSGFLASWAIAVGGALIVAVAVQATYGSDAIREAQHRISGDWRVVPQALITLLAGWAALGAVLSSALCGRIWAAFLPAYACALVGLYGAGIAPYVSVDTTQTISLMFGVALAYGWTACGYSVALSKGFLNWRDVGVAATVWVIGTLAAIPIVLVDRNGAPVIIIVNLLVTAAIAPWASAPVALAWNRHR